MSEQDREAFEAWATKENGWNDYRLWDNGAYRSELVQDAFVNFQAGMQVARAHCAPKPKTTFTEWIGRFMEPYNGAMKEFSSAIRVKPLYGKIEPEDALNNALQTFARWFYENPQAWQRDSEAPKLTEKQAIEAAARSLAKIDWNARVELQKMFGEADRIPSIDESWPDYVHEATAALRAAGLKFRDEA